MRIRGFSLFECLVAMAILAFLFFIAVPSGGRLLAKQRRKNVINQQVSLIYFARLAALSRQQTVVLCPSHDNHNCQNNWRFPLMVFVDKNNNKQRDDNELLLRQSAALNYPVQWMWRGFQSNRYISFSPLGVGVSLSGRFIYCDKSRQPFLAGELIINRAGRIRLRKFSDHCV